MSEKESIKSNIPEFSVSDLAQSMKRTLEETYGRVRVRGELSRVSVAASGHMYSSLKDDGAVIDAVCWKGTMAKLSVKPEEGLEVICTGRISTYPQRSNYQLIIESMELAGEGALLKMLEERRKKLAAEGLFDQARKKPIPFLPDVIGVVTSPTGAVIRDILHRISDRFPRHVILWPAMVQGDGAAEQIAAAIDGFQTIDGHGLPKPDVLIVARGGGSLEDLMAFNEENVVRAVANSEIPVISAVGHETDTTLIDFAADLRAPTPTGAAEKAVPMRNELMALVLDDEKRLINAITRILNDARKHLEAEGRSLANPAKLLEAKAQNLDFAGDKLNQIFQQFIGQKKNRLLETTSRLTHPKAVLNNAAIRVERWSDQLNSVSKKLTLDHEKRLNHASKMLEAYSFHNVLERGFVVVRDSNGKLVPDASTAQTARHLELQFKGEKFVSVQTAENSAAPAKQAKPKTTEKKKQTKNDEKQQSLF